MINKHRIDHAKYELLVNRIAACDCFGSDDCGIVMPSEHGHRRKNKASPNAGANSLNTRLLGSLDPGVNWSFPNPKRVTEDDCNDWFRGLSIRILRDSPSLALRSCFPLAQAHPQITRDLFNAAFLSSWTELSPIAQNDLIEAIKTALRFHESPEIIQVFLNLAEFMEHCDKGPLPLESSILADKAIKCRAFAKALHYKEDEFMKGHLKMEVLESLISINNKLQQSEAAMGVLEFVNKNNVTGHGHHHHGGHGHHGGHWKVKERWYEKLHDWDNALKAYAQKRELNPDDTTSIMGEMRCLEVLGEWKRLHHLAEDSWFKFEPSDRQKMARTAASSAWALSQWRSFEDFCGQIKPDTTDFSFYQAVIHIHRSQYPQAQRAIDRARQLIDADITAMAGESYNRAYGALVQVMMLSELEEVIQYRLIPERREMIKEKWWQRLQGCQRNVEDWQKILQVHSLVMTPNEDMRTWLKFASLCQKNGRSNTSHRILCMLMDEDPAKQPLEGPLPMHHPQVTFAYIKHLWKDTSTPVSSGRPSHKEAAFNYLENFIAVQSGLEQQPLFGTGLPYAEEMSLKLEMKKLLSRCYLKLGDWTEKREGINESSIPNILASYFMATKHDPKWYKAWHNWAYMNYEAVLFHKSQPNYSDGDTVSKVSKDGSIVSKDGSKDEVKVSKDVKKKASSGDSVQTEVSKDVSKLLSKAKKDQIIREYAIPAVNGFFRSITLSHGNSLQDTLRLLTLWFDEGNSPDVHDALNEGIKVVPVETWLQVIPQLIARIDTPRHLIGRLIHQLLMDIGKFHPQALIYPLTVAAKSSVLGRHQAARKILNNMRDHSPNLVSQAILVSDELIRVAILWNELWHEGLEEASRMYFGEKNIQGMMEVFAPLHAMIERGPDTMNERHFVQLWGQSLDLAKKDCLRFQDVERRKRLKRDEEKTPLERKEEKENVKNLSSAWEKYYEVFKGISKRLPTMSSLELATVSPNLKNCKDLELAVPGSYNPSQPVVRIARVEESLTVISSKQRPRRLTIKGSNGKDFMFLLKGHEDLRQDERVMQLFGLVNTLLVNDPETSRRNLAIQRYAVIPLSTNSGLIGWVPHCDTLHTLIRDYREKKKILLNIEHRIMLKMSQDYDHLTLTQKVEVFEHALEHTQGDDLARLLWLKSPSSEVWFDRRTNYTRSLAVMSMVGYVLGLGDRHPSNLMLDRLSGKILHIDFGDCFEVAMTREKFPEKIPFRLTRMLINAMEVTGIEGTYRITCEKVMRVLRHNKDSLMAVLEAFVYDPLLTWRLVDGN